MDCLAAGYMQSSRINAPSLKHGHTYEKVAVGEYEQHLDREVHITCGLFVNPQCPMLASLPDGIINKILIEVS